MAVSRHPGPEPEDLAAAVDDSLRPLLLLSARASANATQRVSTSQLQALLALEQRGPMNLTALAEELAAIPSSATRLCDRLVAADLIVRQQGTQDRREVTLHLTAGGKRVVRQVRDTRRNGLREALDAMSSRERRELLGGLQALARRLDDSEAEDVRSARS